MMIVGMRVAVRLVYQLTRELAAPIGENHVHLGGTETAAVHLLDANADVGKAEPAGYLLKPFHRCTRGNERAEQHVAADSRGRIQDSEASI
jgi:hypothetical protein